MAGLPSPSTEQRDGAHSSVPASLCLHPGKARLQAEHQASTLLLPVPSRSGGRVLFAHCHPHIVIIRGREQVGNISAAYEQRKQLSKITQAPRAESAPTGIVTDHVGWRVQDAATLDNL